MSRAGSVKRDASGAWCFVVDVPTGDGSRKQLRRRGFATKRAAQEALTDVLASAQRGTYVASSRVTVAGYFGTWLDSLPAAGRRPSTVASYRQKVESHLLPALGAVELQGLTATHLDGLYSDLLCSGLSARSVRFLHAIVSKALSDAERKGAVQRNVARLADPPSHTAARAPEQSVWSPSELATFLRLTADHHHGAMFRIVGMTGLRRGELCGLAWSNVDLDNATLSIRQTITSVGHRPVLGSVKTNRSRRVLDIDAATVAVLRRHRTAQLEQRMLMGAGYVDRDLVFCRPDGAPWQPESVSQAFDRAVARADLPRIRLHDLRHSHASHLLAAGVNVKIVSERLGHGSVSFTLDVYAHVMPGQQAGAVAAVAALVDGGHA